MAPSCEECALAPTLHMHVGKKEENNRYHANRFCILFATDNQFPCSSGGRLRAPQWSALFVRTARRCHMALLEARAPFFEPGKDGHANADSYNECYSLHRVTVHHFSIDTSAVIPLVKRLHVKI